MKVKTYLADKEHFEITLNEIGYENVLEIIPCVEYDTTLFMIISRNCEYWELEDND